MLNSLEARTLETYSHALANRQVRPAAMEEVVS
jgi:hypothetical protein